MQQQTATAGATSDGSLDAKRAESRKRRMDSDINSPSTPVVSDLKLAEFYKRLQVFLLSPRVSAATAN
jgi:hypothetical protein